MRIRTVLLLSTLLGICISLSAQVPTSSQNYTLGVSPLVDDLSYTYNGNQLMKVEDSAMATAYAGGTDFRDNAHTPAEYAYDANGNMTSDANKGITGITYNRLNLPEQITFSTGDVIRYVYGYDQTIYTSARDIGNIAAGYIAGINGMSWFASRIAFDLYQKGIEGVSTQNAEYYGWIMGYFNTSATKQISNFSRSLISAWNYLWNGNTK